MLCCLILLVRFISRNILSSVENFFMAFKIITRYFALIFGCQILKFTDYLNLLQNTSTLSTMVGSFISLNLVCLVSKQKFSSLWQVLSKFQLVSNFACSTKFKAQKVKFTKSALGAKNLTASLVALRQS